MTRGAHAHAERLHDGEERGDGRIHDILEALRYIENNVQLLGAPVMVFIEHGHIRHKLEMGERSLSWKDLIFATTLPPLRPWLIWLPVLLFH
jgi:hypothetical protein